MDPQNQIYSGIDNDLIIKQGYVRMKSRLLGGLWKKRYIILYSHSSMGPSRLVKYSDKAAAMQDIKQQSEIRMMDVRSVVRMASDDSRYGITLTMSGDVRQFLCDNETEASDWLQRLQAEIRSQDVLPRGMHRVFLLPSSQLNYSGECCLQILNEKLILSENPDSTGMILTWDLRAIRRYATDEHKNFLKIENGRSQSVTGEGIFLFRTIYFDQIKALLDGSSRRLSESAEASSLKAAQIPVHRCHSNPPPVLPKPSLAKIKPYNTTPRKHNPPALV